MTFFGSAASPAVMPRVSMPPKANITTANEARNPSKPLGNRPPCPTRLPRPGATVAPPAWNPKTMMAAPPTIMAMMMATTLISENQNSSSPKTLTLSRLSAARKKIIARTQIERSTSGNQKPM